MYVDFGYMPGKGNEHMLCLVTEKMWRNEKKLASLNFRVYVGNVMKFMLYTGINYIMFGF